MMNGPRNRKTGAAGGDSDRKHLTGRYAPIGIMKLTV
jgi:hypothetical protein